MLFDNLKGYPRAFKVLVTSALIENMAFGLILPFLTLYMMFTIGLSASLAGVVLMGYTVSGIPAMIFGGMLADKIGRRPVLLMSLGLMSITILMYFFVDSFWTLFVLALADSFVGSMYMPAANAMIADVIPPEGRPKAFSILRIGWNVGIIFGPVLGAVIVAAMSMKFLFVFGASILACAFFMNLVFIPETKPKETGEEITFRKVLSVSRDRPFFLLTALSGVFWLFFSQWMSVLPVYANTKLGVEEYSFGILFAVSAVMTVLFQVWVTSKMMNYTRSSVLLVGQIIASVGFSLIFLSSDFYTLLACIVIITVGEIVYMSMISTVIADLAPESRRGLYMGFAGFIQTLGSGAGFLFGMWLLEVLVQKEYIWLVFGAIGLSTCVGYLFFSRMVGLDINHPTKHKETTVIPYTKDFKEY
ncbi:MAG: MFS transporter [Thermoplasmata archaeon]|nr:MFS transporter [Thermoplasmata archaeon]